MVNHFSLNTMGKLYLICFPSMNDISILPMEKHVQHHKELFLSQLLTTVNREILPRLIAYLLLLTF